MLPSQDGEGAQLVPRSPGLTAPLSFAQQSVRFLQEISPRGVRNIARAYRLAGPIDADRLRRALDELVARHEILRAAFGVNGAGTPCQWASGAAPFSLPVTSTPPAPPADALQRVHELAAGHAREPFDPDHGARLRARLFRLDLDDHVLLLCADPAAADDQALDILAGELGDLYNAPSADAASAPDDPGARFFDSATWEQDAPPVDLGYWTQKLNGLARLNLPTDRPRPAAGARAGFRQRRVISTEVATALQRIAKDQDATLSVAVAAAFAALLARRCAQDEVAVGAMVEDRAKPDLRQAIGRFANILILRVDLSGDPDFLELLTRVRAEVEQAQQHQDVAFGMLAGLGDRQQLSGRAPLIDVLISFADTPQRPLTLPDVAVSEFPLDPGDCRFDLEVFIAGRSGGLVIDVDCRADLFERDSIKLMLDHFARLVTAVADRPALRVSELPLLGEQEAAQLMQWGRGTSSVRSSGKSLPELFRDQVAAQPHAPAVRFGGRVLSYADLDASSDELARALRDRGVRPDVCVGVCAERSVESVVAMLGVIKAGGCYLPLDPTYPPERLSYMLADSAAAILVTTPGEQGRIPGWTDSTVLLFEDGSVSAIAAPRPGPQADPSPQSLAYIIYTSGSTGRPKGVAVQHDGIIRLVCDTDYIRLGPGDHVAHVSNLSFDAATFEVWGALLNGSELVVLTQDELLDPGKLASLLREYRISVLLLTPAVFTSTVREQPAAFEPLSTLLVGGGVMDPSAVRDVLRAGPPDRLLNAYGPTENTVMATAHVVASLPEDAVSVPIGRPVTGTDVYVLDNNQRLVPAGVPGELCVAGLGLARGYLAQPELTRERFVPDPYGPSGSRLYRTGDVARWLPDGVLEFLGRQDDQVKLRGYRIEPGEIQARLAACPGVAAAVVTLRSDDGEPRITAYVVPSRPQQPPEAAELKSALTRWLPGYMIPAAFAVIPEIPLTPAGKVDHARLPAAGRQAGDGDPQAPGADLNEPRTGLVEAVASAWSAILKTPSPGAQDDFFDLGGDSIQATRVVARLKRELGVALKVRDLFDHPTTAGLAEVIAARLEA
jgi:amino acid adenylation domain-containing protein